MAIDYELNNSYAISNNMTDIRDRLVRYNPDMTQSTIQNYLCSFYKLGIDDDNAIDRLNSFNAIKVILDSYMRQSQNSMISRITTLINAYPDMETKDILLAKYADIRVRTTDISKYPALEEIRKKMIPIGAEILSYDGKINSKYYRSVENYLMAYLIIFEKFTADMLYNSRICVNCSFVIIPQVCNVFIINHGNLYFAMDGKYHYRKLDKISSIMAILLMHIRNKLDYSLSNLFAISSVYRLRPMNCVATINHRFIAFSKEKLHMDLSTSKIAIIYEKYLKSQA